MEFFNTFPHTHLRGKNRGLDWVLQKIAEFQKTVDNIPDVVNDVIGDAISKGEIDVTVNVETDSTFTRPGVGADAAAVGERFDSLTAEDVGARAADWMPTAAEVGARAADWLPTAAEVGARAADWMPTAAEVGARAADWMPTAAEVGARAADWMPTAAEVGAFKTEYVSGGLATFSRNLGGVSNIRFRVSAYLFMVCRLTGAAAATSAVYVIAGYNEFRAPLLTQLSVGTGIEVKVEGDNTNGWYVNVGCTNGAGAVMYLIGNCIPTFE